MKKHKDVDKIISTIISVIIFALVVGYVAVEVYVLIHYGKLPITEVPAWAIPFLIKK